MKRKVAAIIVRDKRVVSTGYNGTPRGTRNCNEGGCPRCNSLAPSGTALDECLCSHGEENAIVQASYHGVSLKDAIIYTTFAPCLQCSKMIINSGIREVIYNMDYPLNDSAFRLIKSAIDRNYCATDALQSDPLLVKFRGSSEFSQLVSAAKACQDKFRAERK